MPRRTEIMAAQPITTIWNGAGINSLIETPSGVLYLVYVDSRSDVAFKKSLDKGLTWSAPTVVYAGTVTNLAVWYDRWSGLASDYIHCVYTDSGNGDTAYCTINAGSADALSTATNVFLGGTTAPGGHLSVTRSRGGNVYCKTVIDAGAEGGFYKLLNANFPNGAWEAALTVDEAIATTDQMILLPGFAADNNDILAVFWDASANELSRKIYDDSANTWAEASISGSMTDVVATTTFPHFAAFVDLTNSQIVVAAWSAVDTLNADLRCWKITEGAITEVTNVVLNSTDDQGFCALGLATDTGWWYCFYAGKSDGSETIATAVNLYLKISKDGGTTWGDETKLTSRAYSVQMPITAPRFTGKFPLAFVWNLTINQIMASVEIAQPQASSIIVGG